MENKINIYRLGIIILMILLFIHMFNVNLYADDYNKINSVKRIGIYFEDITELIKETSKAIYQGWSGRIISQNLVPLILITQNNIVYQILNPIIIFIFCYLLSKIINMDNKYSLEKILFFVLIIVLGLDISLSNNVLYWADGGIVLFWTCIPTLILIYIIYNKHYKNEKLKNIETIFLTLLLIIINFSVESLMIFTVGILFFCVLKNILDKNNDFRVIFLFIIGFLLLMWVCFIPGNLNRIEIEKNMNPEFRGLDNIQIIYKKLKIFLVFIFNEKIISTLLIVTSMCLSINYLKNSSIKKYDFVINIINLILNIIFITISKIYQLRGTIFFENIGIYFIYTIYIMFNIYLLYKYLKNINIFLIYICISAFAASLITVFVTSYALSRYFLPIIISFIILDLYIFYKVTKNEKNFMLLIYIILTFSLYSILAVVILGIMKLIKPKCSLYKLILIIFVIYNLVYFFNVMIKYYYNDKIFNENILTIENEKIKGNNTIYLKKLKYKDYAYDMPDCYEYVDSWYREFYEIENYEIVWY